MKTFFKTSAAVSAAAIFAWAGAANAQKSKDTVTMAFLEATQSIDPYSFTKAENNFLGRAIWDTLVTYDANIHAAPTAVRPFSTAASKMRASVVAIMAGCSTHRGAASICPANRRMVPQSEIMFGSLGIPWKSGTAWCSPIWGRRIKCLCYPGGAVWKALVRTKNSSPPTDLSGLAEMPVSTWSHAIGFRNGKT